MSRKNTLRGSLKSAAFLFIAVLLMGCGSEALPSNSATLQAEMSGYVAEATAIQAESESHTERISATVAALEADAAHRVAVNAALHATLQVVNPPMRREGANAGGMPTPAAILQGQRWFVKTGMSSRVRDSDGCSETLESQFTPSTPRIYATFKAYNIEAGTRLSVSWTHNGRTAHEESFHLDRSAGEICLWFYIDPETVEFAPGLWSVQLYAEGFPLESAIPFNIS